MIRIARAFQVGLCLVVALCFVGFATMYVLTAGSPTSAPARDVAAILLVVASPALLATWVVVGAWSKRLTRQSAAHPGAPSDGPGLLVAAAAGLLPADRREFGPAMAAELAAIEGSRERWSFALGCCRACLLKPRWRGGRIVLLAAGLLGVVGVLAVTARLVILDESATVGTAHGVVLAAAVLVVLVLTVSPPAALGYDLGPVLFGIVVAAVLSVGFLLASSFPSGAGEGVASFLILGPAGALFLVGAAARGSRARCGTASLPCFGRPSWVSSRCTRST